MNNFESPLFLQGEPSPKHHFEGRTQDIWQIHNISQGHLQSETTTNPIQIAAITSSNFDEDDFKTAAALHWYNCKHMESQGGFRIFFCWSNANIWLYDVWSKMWIFDLKREYLI